MTKLIGLGILGLTLAVSAQAGPSRGAHFVRDAIQAMHRFGPDDLECNASDWKTGDTSSHHLFLNGEKDTLFTLTVTGGDEDTVWRKLESTFLDGAKPEVHEFLYNRADCKTLKWIFNGKEQPVPPGANYEFVSTEWREVVVPAGSFRALCIQTKYQKFQFSRCFNPADTVMEGRIAQRIEKPGDMLITTELLSFKRGGLPLVKR